MATNNDKWTDIPPTPLGERVDPQRTVIGRTVELGAGARVRPHSHRRDQLIYAPQGLLRVVTETGSWSVPAKQAVWVPGGIEHAIEARIPLTIQTLFIDPSVTRDMPRQCQVLSLSILMRALLQRAANVDESYPVAGPEQRLMEVILDELRTLVPEPLHLPMAKDPRVRKVMEALLEKPGDSRRLDEWAAVAGATARTLARGFQRETGLSFGQWRTRLRLVEGVERLQRGESVTRVALELGYANPSAFIAMFHRELGVPPGALRQTSD